MTFLTRTIGAVAGTTGGVAATVAMTGVLAVAGARGWLGEPPPKRIVEHVIPPMSEAATNATTAVSHVAYGAAAGALYGALGGHRRLPAAVALLTGSAFGMAVWAVSYEGWVPAAGILPPAHRDRPSRSGTMVVAHIVYGAVLGLSTRRPRR